MKFPLFVAPNGLSHLHLNWICHSFFSLFYSCRVSFSFVFHSEDPDIHFKYIEATANTGNQNFIEKTKNFIMKANLPDAQMHVFLKLLELLLSEQSQDVHVCNDVGKIMIDIDVNLNHLLITNQYYDSRIVGKYCEKWGPTFAIVAYQMVHCDAEHVTNKNPLLKLQTR